MTKKTTFQILKPSAQASSDAGLDALREQAATSLERALGYVASCEDSFALLRAHVLLEATPVEEGIAALESRQQADGGFAPGGGVFSAEIEALLETDAVPSPVRGALEAMAILSDWRVLYAPATERLVAHLAAIQNDDGSWGAAGDDAEPSSGQLFASGMIAGYLGRTRSARPATLQAVQPFLAAHWAVARIREAGWPLVAAYTHFYTNVPDDNAEVALPWCGRELERGYQAREYTARQTMRVLIDSDASALPGATFDVGDLLTRLLTEQAEDGAFTANDFATSTRIGPTLDGMMATMRLCRMLPPE